MKKIHLPQFDYTVRIYISDDPGAVYGRLTGDHEYWSDTTNAMHLYLQGGMESCVIFYPKPSVSSISHEAFHAVWRMMKVIGARFENEIMAYHVGYISEQVFRFAYEDKKKKTKRSTVA